MSKVKVHKRAAKYVQKLPKVQYHRIKKILKQLEENPLKYSCVKSMIGQWTGYHRIKVGNIRIIFWFNKEKDVVYVDHIGPRGDVYKKSKY